MPDMQAIYTAETLDILLDRENSLLLKAVEATSDGILIADNQGRVLFVNHAYEEITGLKREEMIGKNLQFLLDEKIFNISASLLVLENQKTVSLMHRYVTGKNALTTANLIHDPAGEIIGVINITRDISKLIRLKNQLSAPQGLELFISDSESDQEQLQEEGFIYKSKSMAQLINFTAKIAAFDSTVLIQGESGTGKEVLARYIHQHGSRRDGPFVKVNCAAIPETLFESELFGYAPGSFTGALSKGKKGLFEMANNGIILLDEISELPLPVQSKLLRVIQEREVLGVGCSTPVKLNVRIIAATNKDLKTEVALGHFREDLYFRINVVPVSIPPLRERREDVPELIRYFLEKLNRQYKKTVTILPETVEMMRQYSWPGNIRELENLTEYLFITSSNDEISVDQLPMQIIASHALNDFTQTAEGQESRLDHMLDLFEKHTLVSVLANHTSMRKAADYLGIHASTLCRKMKKHNIPVEPGASCPDEQQP